MIIRIENVQQIKQHEVTLYQFALSAEDIMKHCKVLRFGQDDQGVNRKYDADHAIAIAESMMDPTMPWVEPIYGCLLGGEWEFVGGVLKANNGAFVCIDDGQHRYMALSLLKPEEREHIVMPVMVAQGLTYEERLKVFSMQGKRKAIATNLKLAISDRLGSWKSERQGEAYDIIRAFATDESSPLKGMIEMEEVIGNKIVGQRGPLEKIPASGLHNTLGTVLGNRSPLKRFNAEERQRILFQVVREGSRVWANAWESPECVLRTSRGINALLRLIVSGPNFRGEVGSGFSDQSIRNALRLGRSFDWSIEKHRRTSLEEIMNRLDQSIGRRANSTRKTR